MGILERFGDIKQILLTISIKNQKGKHNMIKDIILVNDYETYILQNVLHMGFWKAVKQRVTAYIDDPNTINEKLPGKLKTQWYALNSAMGQEDEYYLLANKSEYTARIEAADKVRDDLFRKIKKFVDTYAAVDFDQAKNEAALTMQPVMKRYAIDVTAAYEVETTKIDQWIGEQNTNHQLNLAATALGIKDQITALKTANDEVRQLISYRMDEQAYTPQAALKTARQATDEAWKWFVLALNSYAVADETDYRFEQLIRGINSEIAYSKEQYEALKKKNSKKKDDEDGDDPEPTPDPTPEPEPGPGPEPEPDENN